MIGLRGIWLRSFIMEGLVAPACYPCSGDSTARLEEREALVSAAERRRRGCVIDRMYV
jgi:hypothetical protein